MGFPSAQTVKNLPAMQETQVQSLGREDPLEEEMAKFSTIFAWKFAWKEESAVHRAAESRTRLSN